MSFSTGSGPSTNAKAVVDEMRQAVKPHVTEARDALKRQYVSLEFAKSWIMIIALVGLTYLCFSEFREWKEKWPLIYKQVESRQNPSIDLHTEYCNSNMVSDTVRMQRQNSEYCLNAKATLGRSLFLDALRELARDEVMQHAGILATSIEACYNSFWCKYALVNKLSDWFISSWAKDVVVPAIGAVFASVILALVAYIYKSMPMLRRLPGGLPLYDTTALEFNDEDIAKKPKKL